MIRLALVLMLARVASATVFYIDPSGTTSCTCKTSPPFGCGVSACRNWATLNGCTPALQPGDTVQFCTGTYRETVSLSQDGTAGNPITIKAAPGNTPIVSGVDLCTSWTADGSNVFHCAFTPALGGGCTNGIQKLFVDGVPLAEAQATGCPSVATLAASGYCDVWPQIDCTSNADCAATPNPTSPSGTCVFSKWCWDGTSVFVHLNNNSSPATHTVEVGSRQALFAADSRHDFTVDGLTFFGGESFCTAREPITFANNGATGTVIIKNNTWQYDGVGGMISTGSANLTVDHNTFTDMGQGWSYPPDYFSTTTPVPLIRTQSGSNVTITNNTVTRYGWHNWAHCRTGAGTDRPSCDCGQIASNANTGKCVVVAIEVQSPTAAGAGTILITDNTLTNTEGGQDCEPTTGAVLLSGSSISRNHITAWPHDAAHSAYHTAEDALGIRCTTGGGADSACTSIVVHQLLMDRNELRGGFRTGLALNVGNLQGGDTYTVRATNNLIAGGDMFFGNTIDAGLVLRAEGPAQSIQLYNNTFHCDAASPRGGSGALIGTGVTGDIQNNIFDFAGCTTKFTDTGSATWNTTNDLCDVASTGHCATASPAFAYVSTSAKNYRLASGSGGIDQGSTLAAVTTDVDGLSRPQGSAYDVGASEFTGTTTSTSATTTSTSTSSSVTTSTSTSITTTTSSSTSTSTSSSSTSSSSTSTTSSTSTSTTNPGAMCFHCKGSNCRIGH